MRELARGQVVNLTSFWRMRLNMNWSRNSSRLLLLSLRFLLPSAMDLHMYTKKVFLESIQSPNLLIVYSLNQLVLPLSIGRSSMRQCPHFLLERDRYFQLTRPWKTLEERNKKGNWQYMIATVITNLVVVTTTILPVGPIL